LGSITSIPTGVKLAAATLLAPLAVIAAQLEGRLSRMWAFARLRTSVPSLHASVIVQGVPEIHGTRRIELGRNLYLYRAIYLETQGRGSIRIGDDVVLSRGVHICAFARIEIGCGSMIGEYTSVRDANHDFESQQPLRAAGHRAEPIRIGRDVWIGRGTTVLAGVTIGDGAVVGANAVVTRDVSPRTVVGGVPARVIHREGR